MPVPQAVVLGCSAGGLNALEVVLAQLDPALPQALIVCCHTGSSDVDMFCELLALHSTLPVSEAVERHPALGGTVHVAPSGYHLLVEADHRFSLSIDPKVCYSRPAIDVLFASAAAAYRERLVGVLMTGANHDGASGLAEIRRHGGIAVVQDPRDAEAPSMPQAALDLAGADHCVTLHEIGPLLNRLCLP
jgi:two-component system chemotaxis response regulator CheB